MGNQRAGGLGEALVCGGGAGAVEATIMFPAESIKTQLQLQDKANPRFKSPMDVVAVTVRENGVRGLYRGLSVLVSGSVPKAAVRFMTFEAAKRHVESQTLIQNAAAQTFLCGLVAGFAEALFVVTPAEVLKTRLIHDLHAPPDKRLYRGLTHGVSTIFKTEGAAGLYHGLSATLLKQGSNQAVRFVVKEQIDDAISKADTNNVIFRPVRVAIAGALAGAASVFANNPIDVVKSKMQGIGAREAGHTTFVRTGRAILRGGGISAFYAGVTPRLVRVMGDSAIAFTIYGELKDLYERYVRRS